MTPKAAGLVFLPFCLPVMFSPLAGTYVDRVGARWPGSISFASGGVAFTLMALVRNDSALDLALLLVGLLIFGVIFTFAAVSASSEVATSITELEAAHPGVFGDKGGFSTALGRLHICNTFNCFVVCSGPTADATSRSYQYHSSLRHHGGHLVWRFPSRRPGLASHEWIHGSVVSSNCSCHRACYWKTSKDKGRCAIAG